MLVRRAMMLDWLWHPLFSFGVTANEAVITGQRVPIPNSHQQLTVTVAVKLTLPTKTITNPTSGATESRIQSPGFIIVQCNGGSVRWCDDGTVPTAALGQTIASGAELDYVGDFANITFILSTGTPIIDVNYYF